MTDGTHVREGRSADVPPLRAIQAAVLAEPWEELLAVAADGPPILLVATPAGAATGTGDATTPVGYALAVTDGDDDAGYLAELAVAPDHQGEGHGSALLDALVDRLRESGVRKLRVTVREVDEDARTFYRERGFERRERLPEHYERGDGFLLERRLDD
ncbi:Pab N-terminal acetyltransferase [Halosimplex carlsbadense 2-9-1]|uniref:Pab N-terminal acetyltransferase n=1 Tax=Halosimplex carlsbadense 2-9-1 TaxID=797114 RepID=M0CJZ1_9EURY|nr:GNAT family N-acetyltransferase [Halosimplex carlsbadense]ELZ23536.1 Pab N-terminal acetyltransferase [Halosimplex carlsbadense 2-9-1]